MTLNLLMNFIFPEPVELWKFILIEICLGFCHLLWLIGKKISEVNMKYVVILILIGLLFLLFVPYMLADYIKPLQKFFCK